MYQLYLRRHTLFVGVNRVQRDSTLRVPARLGQIPLRPEEHEYADRDRKRQRVESHVVILVQCEKAVRALRALDQTEEGANLVSTQHVQQSRKSTIIEAVRTVMPVQATHIAAASGPQLPLAQALGELERASTRKRR
jgi:hypothetical protein